MSPTCCYEFHVHFIYTEIQEFCDFLSQDCDITAIVQNDADHQFSEGLHVLDVAEEAEWTESELRVKCEEAPTGVLFATPLWSSRGETRNSDFRLFFVVFVLFSSTYFFLSFANVFNFFCWDDSTTTLVS